MDDAVKKAEEIAKEFGRITRTDWHEWTGYVWEILDKKRGKPMSKYFIIQSLHKIRNKDYGCGITNISWAKKLKRTCMPKNGPTNSDVRGTGHQ